VIKRFEYKNIVLSVLLAFLAVVVTTAQENHVVFENSKTSHFVSFNPISEYHWEVVTNFTPLIYAGSEDYSFTSEINSNEIEILWKNAGQYYIVLTETDNSGCNNTKALAITVLPNTRSVGFENVTSSSCFPLTDGFEAPVSVINANGGPLENEFFPLNVSFTVNGITHSQAIDFNNQKITVSEQWFTVSENQNSTVEVKITGVTDVNNLPVNIRNNNNTFIYTIFAVPDLAFENHIPDTIPLNSSFSFRVNGNLDYTYSWWFTDENGTRYDFTSPENQTENYAWNLPGNYKLFVQAEDINGCTSEIISKPFTVNEEEVPLPQLVALPDFIMGYENTTIYGNVGTNDFISPARSWNLEFSLVGGPYPGLIFNPDGSFVYFPPEDFVGKISFSYRVCFDDETLGCATSEALIHLISSNSDENIAPVAATDVVLTFPNRMVVSNLLINDIDPDGDNLILTTIPVINPLFGVVEIAEDGSFSYTPNTDFEGSDKFMYRICDTGIPSLCDSAWVYIIVNNFGPGNSKPISTSDDIFISNEGTTFTLTGNDYDLLGHNLIYNTTPVVDVQHGILDINEDGTFTYRPESGYSGIVWFIYEVCNTNNPPDCRRGTGFILVNLQGSQIAALAGKDTTISSCNPYVLGGIPISGEGFSYLWEPAAYLDDPTSPNPVFTPGNSTTFRLTVTNDQGFYAIDSVLITVSEVIADAGGDVSKYSDQTIVLDGSGSSGINLQYLWTTQNGKIESGTNTANPLVSGFGTYYLEVTDTFGCVATDSVNVGILTYAPVAVDDYDTTSYKTEVKIPVLDNDSDPENDINPNTLAVISAPFNGTAYVNYDDFTIHYRPDDNFSGTDFFEYRICDFANNCDKAKVTVLVTDFRFFIPDAFSPNGDNINDYFEIIGIEEYEGNSIEIFNRWGNRVYQAKNYGINTVPKFWDGRSNTGIRLGNDELPTGTYYYVLNIGEKRIAGSVYLDR
jgi:gliding motility-associated-like protein